MRLIGLAGPLECGKTTAAMHLVDHHGFCRQRFAGPLKDMLRALGLTDEELDGKLKMSPCPILGGKTPRWAMQSLGTEWGRNLIHPDLWVIAWKHRLCSDRVVADDVRFPNEVTAIRELGGTVVMIERPGKGGDSHASEQFEFTPDRVIVNDGTIEQLYRKVEELLCR